MDQRQKYFRKTIRYGLPWLVLAFLLSCSYAKFFQHPYGFRWDQNGIIDVVFVQQPSPTLMVGDQLVQIGSLSWDQFHADLRKTFFDGVKIGQVVAVTVARNGRVLTVPWILPGMNLGEVRDQLFSEWFLAYFFWAAGTFALHFLRGDDNRLWLLSGFNFITAIWLSAGSGLSNFHIGYSALILRAAVWLTIPVYLQMHWDFPRPLGKWPRTLVWIGYGAALALVVAQAFQLLPQRLYYAGFLVSTLGSLILLVVHYLRQPDVRRDLRLLLTAGILALTPLVAISLAGVVNSSIHNESLAFLSLPALPLAYLYAGYRGQLGDMQARANRLLSAYFFLILLGSIGLPLLAVADRLLPSAPDELLVVTSLTGLVVAVLSLWVYPVFRNFLERRWLGISIDSGHLPAAYAAHVIYGTSPADLARMIRDDILPSLLIRQFVFLQFDGGSPKILLEVGLEGHDPLLSEQIISKVVELRDNYPSPLTGDQIFPWIKIILPLKVGTQILGFWLFGKRDPDDLYPRNEIPVFVSLANQTAVALSNVVQTERLKVLYKANIDSHEQELARLSRELHDRVLNELAVLRMNFDPESVSPALQTAYERVTLRLREIVGEMRPPLLSYGLKAALRGLGENLMQRSKDTINVIVNITGEDRRYLPNIEQHLFRIVQETCENAFRHAKAKQITVSGNLEEGRIELDVTDDGIGFDAKEGLRLDTLLAMKHFGLAGILERAELIGAQINIKSTPGSGTQVSVRWASSQP